MKNFLIIILAILLIRPCSAEPPTSDLVAGIDPTAYSTVTGANLLQLVSNGTIGQTNKGAIIRSTFVPSVVNNPRYTNFLWIDISAGLPGTLKQWNGSAWVAAAVGTGGILSTNLANGAVGQPQLATNAVATINIQNNAVDATKIGALQVLSTHIADGAVSNRHLADQTITGAKMAFNTLQGTNILDASVNGTKLIDASVTAAKLAPGAISSTVLSSNIIYATNIVSGAVGNDAITNAAVTTNKVAVTGGSAYQVMQIDPTSAFVQWGTPVFSRSSSTNGGTITTVASGYTNAHGLGARPTLVFVTMTNTVPEYGYSVGDEIPISNGWDATTQNTVSFDNSNVYVIFQGALPVIADRALGSGGGRITTARWGLKIRAFR